LLNMKDNFKKIIMYYYLEDLWNDKGIKLIDITKFLNNEESIY
jgi:hypothetical protein